MDPTRYHAHKHDLPVQTLGGYRTRAVRFGAFTAVFEEIPAGFPPGGTALYSGLPDDACQAPHWGYVFKGKVKFTYPDGSEQVVSAGEAYHAPAGHQFACLEDAETIEFSPADALDRHMEVVARNLAAALPRAAPRAVAAFNPADAGPAPRLTAGTR